MVPLRCWAVLLVLPFQLACGFQSPVRRTTLQPSMSPTSRTLLLRASSTTDNTIDNNNNNNIDNVFDVCICGAGPSGLLLASHLAQLGCSVQVVDPALNKPWPNNYGVWMDEACFFGYEDCIDRVWKQAGVVYDEDTPQQLLDRPYGRVDRQAMKARLLQECEEAAGNVVLTAAKATHVEHLDDRPAQVTLQAVPTNNNNDKSDNNNDDNNNNNNNNVVQALLVVDATGFTCQFVKHEVPFDPGFQVTYGARFRVQDLGPYQLDRMVLMDYSERHLADDPQLVASNDRFPSFVYVMPLAEDELFLEETILVSRPGGSSRNLQQRLERRMNALNITALQVLEDERAAIPMGGADPIVPQRTIGFGATASLVHPASGYMVARAMEVAPRVARHMLPQVQTLRHHHRAHTLTADVLEHASAEIWKAVWPADERRQRDFMHFGFELLCRLNPQELRDFFTGFFRLPAGLWEHFLSWRLSGVGHIVMGLTVWATCIPRRFMGSMLINSLPFLADKLVWPFATRGNPLYTESVYWDAQSNNSTLWEPDTYYPYLEDLKSREYPGKDMSKAAADAPSSDTISPTTTAASPITGGDSDKNSRKEPFSKEDRVKEPTC